MTDLGAPGEPETQSQGRAGLPPCDAQPVSGSPGVPDGVTVGPIRLEYDGRGIGVGTVDELRGYAEPFTPDEWAAFARAAERCAGTRPPDD